MNNILKKIYPIIPEQYKDEVTTEFLQENFIKISVISTVLFFAEAIIFQNSELFFDVGEYILPFLIVNLVLVPSIWYVRITRVENNKRKAKVIQYIYMLSVMLLGCFLSLGVQGKADLVHIYMITVYGAVFFVFMMPLEFLVLIMAVYAIYYTALPYFQPNPEIIATIRVNSFIFSLFAVMLGGMLNKMKLDSFFDKKLLQEQNFKLKELANKDSMTGLINHVTVFQRLEQEIFSAKRTGYPLSLIIVDIDDFKRINDIYGHQIGDNVIIKIAEAMRSAVRSSDIIGRYGGEEFIIILPNTDLESAKILSVRIQKAINDIKCETVKNVTLSGGISQYTGETVNDFIRITDEKLYTAKRKGKDRFEI